MNDGGLKWWTRGCPRRQGPAGLLQQHLSLEEVEEEEEKLNAGSAVVIWRHNDEKTDRPVQGSG
jgi:hypothetical protein